MPFHARSNVFLTSALLLFLGSCKPTSDNIDPLNQLISNSEGIVAEVCRNPQTYELQIIYTQIDRDSHNQPHFTTYRYGVDTLTYFYPASTVKMPTAFMALEKLNQLEQPGLTVDTPMLTDSAYSRQYPVMTDSTAQSGLPSVRHYVKKIFIVSDNEAFNRLYEFVGQGPLNEGLHQKGFEDLRIVHRLEIFLSEDENRHTNPVYFVDDKDTVYQQPMLVNNTTYPRPDHIYKGKGEMISDSLVEEPKDFATKNYIALHALTDILKTVLFPEAVPQEQRFNLTPSDYAMLYQYMSQKPGESNYPNYSDTTYYDSYAKFFLFGDKETPIPPAIRIFNKVGWAYGYLTDVAYIVDFDHNIEFMLSATISVNENQIYNDGNYQYDEIGLPFLAQLGQMVYDYELTRDRAHIPNLEKFRVSYD